MTEAHQTQSGLCDNPQNLNKNVETLKATIFNYQPGVHKNLEVIVLYVE